MTLQLVLCQSRRQVISLSCSLGKPCMLCGANRGIDMSNIQTTNYFISSRIQRHFLHGRWNKDEGKLVVCSDGIVVLRVPCADAGSARGKAERMIDGMIALGRK